MRHMFRFDRNDYRSLTEFFHKDVPVHRPEGEKLWSGRLLCEVLNVGYHLHLRKFNEDEPHQCLAWHKYKDLRPLVCTPTNKNRVWSGVKGEESIRLFSKGHHNGTALVNFEYHFATQKYVEFDLKIKEWSAITVVVYSPERPGEKGHLAIGKVLYC